MSISNQFGKFCLRESEALISCCIVSATAGMWFYKYEN